MSYIFQGTIRGRVSPDDVEPLSSATVKLYRLPRVGTAGQPPASSFTILSPEDERGKEYLLFAMGWTNERGEFSIDLGEPSVSRPGIPDPYRGEAFQVDVLCRDVPRRTEAAPRDAVHLSLGVVEPEWRESGGARTAAWDHELSEREWGRVRALLDAWVISGRVVTRDGRTPRTPLRVWAFDADPLQDDVLGTATAAEDGRFRIDYSGKDFRSALMPGVDFEAGVPELYFRIESEEGLLLFDERRMPGARPTRGGVDGCYYAELTIDAE